MKYHLIGAIVASTACAPAVLAAEGNKTIGLEPTVNTVCLDTRLTYDGAKACHEQMSNAETMAERREIMRRFAARIDGQTPLRNSLTSSGAGVKHATPVPGGSAGIVAGTSVTRGAGPVDSTVTLVRRSRAPVDTSFTSGNFHKFTATSEGEWKTIQGEVISADGNTFQIDDGDSIRLVEMDDFDLHNENPVETGDYVTVTGKQYEAADGRLKLEASLLYLDRLNSEFYASAANEEGFNRPLVPNTGGDQIVSRAGTVSDHKGDELSLSTETRTLVVNMAAAETAAAVETGDELRVYGRQNGDQFEATHTAVLRRSGFDGQS